MSTYLQCQQVLSGGEQCNKIGSTKVKHNNQIYNLCILHSKEPDYEHMVEDEHEDEDSGDEEDDEDGIVTMNSDDEEEEEEEEEDDEEFEVELEEQYRDLIARNGSDVTSDSTSSVVPREEKKEEKDEEEGEEEGETRLPIRTYAEQNAKKTQLKCASVLDKIGFKNFASDVGEDPELTNLLIEYNKSGHGLLEPKKSDTITTKMFKYGLNKIMSGMLSFSEAATPPQATNVATSTVSIAPQLISAADFVAPVSTSIH